MRARARKRNLLLALCLFSPACGPLVQYTDELRNRHGHRSVFVTGPAQTGAVLGFLVGIPLDVGFLPVTYVIYQVQKSRQPETADWLTTMMFPSLATLGFGTLLGAPFDLIEYSVYRAWRPPESLTEEEQRELEYQIDEETLPRYPVETLYPSDKANS